MKIPGKENLLKAQAYKERIINNYRSKVRERAISKAKARIALMHKKIEDFNEDELEIIVHEEEEKVKGNLMKASLVVVLLTLGIT